MTADTNIHILPGNGIAQKWGGRIPGWRLPHTPLALVESTFSAVLVTPL
ncbi:MAG: hypothetical protein WB992_21585 [Bryobacteraceae bacterium]